MEPTSLTPVDSAGQNPMPAGQPQPAVASAPMAADDSDLIEPEWVAAVQKIMALYHDDPYALAQAMTALREDYLMKRYGRQVGSAE